MLKFACCSISGLGNIKCFRLLGCFFFRILRTIYSLCITPDSHTKQKWNIRDFFCLSGSNFLTPWVYFQIFILYEEMHIIQMTTYYFVHRSFSVPAQLYYILVRTEKYFEIHIFYIYNFILKNMITNNLHANIRKKYLEGLFLTSVPQWSNSVLKHVQILYLMILWRHRTVYQRSNGNIIFRDLAGLFLRRIICKYLYCDYIYSSIS